ncbi:hypothetical protein SLEP1_g42537 [Rubroshorea leprosula]|uniref:Secreted protein n=1 Tax=Rubroshorea leprosula TaxID=152421 RepID=A0AAV5LAJ5_9ROSI|nr:hypothetical protein SLEP1_g42537 [Rubroshorea leprosula]
MLDSLIVIGMHMVCIYVCAWLPVCHLQSPTEYRWPPWMAYEEPCIFHVPSHGISLYFCRFCRKRRILFSGFCSRNLSLLPLDEITDTHIV